jgi:hypothetical protein
LYVAAVAFTERDSRLCQSVQATPLLASEKAREPFPEFHPTELYFVFAAYYQSTTSGQSRWWSGSSSSTTPRQPVRHEVVTHVLGCVWGHPDDNR